jgi:small subunit ribosomal protein S21
MEVQLARKGITVYVGPDGNVERALRKLKKKVQESRLLLELKDRQHYVKPTTQRKLKKGAARSRWRKYLDSQKLPPKNF